MIHDNMTNLGTHKVRHFWSRTETEGQAEAQLLAQLRQQFLGSSRWLVIPSSWSLASPGYCRLLQMQIGLGKIEETFEHRLGNTKAGIDQCFLCFCSRLSRLSLPRFGTRQKQDLLKKICEDVPNLELVELDMEELIGSLKLSMGWTGWTMNWKGILQNQPVLPSALGGGQPSGPERSQRSSGPADGEFLPNFEQKWGVNNGYNNILWGYNMGHIY